MRSASLEISCSEPVMAAPSFARAQGGDPSLLEIEGQEILVPRPGPDRRLDQLMNHRADRHRHFELARMAQSEVEVLPQELGGEGRGPVHLDQILGAFADTVGSEDGAVEELEA